MEQIIQAILEFLRSIFGGGDEKAGENKQKPDEQSPIAKGFDESYYKKNSLLSKVENAWYGVAIETLGAGAIICPKVRVEDVVGVQKGLGRSGSASARNRIKSRHFDFVICNRGLAPLAVVEIDDSSHNTDKGKAQDELKNSICEATSLPILRFKSNPTASKEDIREAVSKINGS